jgi:hypothetical protein
VSPATRSGARADLASFLANSGTLQGRRRRKPFTELLSDPAARHAGVQQSCAVSFFLSIFRSPDCFRMQRAIRSLRGIPALGRQQAVDDPISHRTQKLQVVIQVRKDSGLFLNHYLMTTLASWNQVFTLPIKYQDLPLSSQITFTVYDAGGPSSAAVVGGSTLRLFGKNSTLKKGKQRLYLWEGQEADGGIDTTTPSKMQPAVGEIDQMGRLEKVRPAHYSRYSHQYLTLVYSL